MKINLSELEIKNKKFVIKYGVILLVISFLVVPVRLYIIPNTNISWFYWWLLVFPFFVFTSSFILLYICYHLQIVSKYDFTRTFKNNTVNDINKNGDVLKTWFWIQIFFGFFGYPIYFGWILRLNTTELKQYEIDLFLLFLISPTILFIISSYFARLNRIENKIDILLSQKEENQND
jgi:hypothetical protein